MWSEYQHRLVAVEQRIDRHVLVTDSELNAGYVRHVRRGKPGGNDHVFAVNQPAAVGAHGEPTPPVSSHTARHACHDGAVTDTETVCRGVVSEVVDVGVRGREVLVGVVGEAGGVRATEKAVPVVAEVELVVRPAGKALVDADQLSVARKAPEERTRAVAALQNGVVAPRGLKMPPELQPRRPGADDAVRVALRPRLFVATGAHEG